MSCIVCIITMRIVKGLKGVVQNVPLIQIKSSQNVPLRVSVVVARHASPPVWRNVRRALATSGKVY
jgi:hypothetical protein